MGRISGDVGDILLLEVMWLRALHLTSSGVAEMRGLEEKTGCRNVSFWFNEVEMFRCKGTEFSWKMGIYALQSVWDGCGVVRMKMGVVNRMNGRWVE